MTNIELPSELECLRCNHKWIPRKRDVRRCPRCGTPYWDKPKDKPKGEES